MYSEIFLLATRKSKRYKRTLTKGGPVDMILFLKREDKEKKRCRAVVNNKEGLRY